MQRFLPSAQPTEPQRLARRAGLRLPGSGLRLLPRPGSALRALRAPGPPLGQRLVARGVLSPGDLVRALALQAREDVPLGEILLAHGLVRREDLLDALAEQWDAELVDFRKDPPDTRLIDAFGVANCIAEGVVPWRRVGLVTVVATARPERFAQQADAYSQVLGPVAMALTTEDGVADAVTRLRSQTLARNAETRVPETQSCRTLSLSRPVRLAAAVGAAAAALATFVTPGSIYLGLLAWAVLTLAAIQSLKIATLVLALRRPNRGHAAIFRSRRAPPPAQKLPVVSVLVPLFHEADVAGPLIDRLARLTYPRELTDIVLVCEEDDATTAAALAHATLPPWIRVVVVPRGGVQTKPRALNYALDFCRGGIVGIWDAEDAPAPDQLYRVVRRFQETGPEVACLQGILDYFNSRTNWLSRCFTLEYAAWFRIMLPGLMRLGLPIPLGGTTLFLRRAALEGLGGWDAHNVTEDADLGLRLARAGYRTEIIDTVTEEEANCQAWPWVRQRSRWLKGYAITWASHMRAPHVLWRDLGPAGFLGVQVLFLGTLSQFLLAPVLWVFWFLALGLPLPGGARLEPGLVTALTAFFVASEAVNLAMAMLAAERAGKSWLVPWAFTLPFYFPLAVAAVWRGLWELTGKPFVWHKTAHGLHKEQREPDETASGGAQVTAPPVLLAARPGPSLPIHRADTIDGGARWM